MHNKNILIGGLIAIVVVMVSGYAAFATQLNINGTAKVINININHSNLIIKTLFTDIYA